MRAVWTRNRRAARSVAALALLAAAACRHQPSAPPFSAEPAPRPATRIAVMAPAAAEMLAALGAADEVVAVGDFVTYPPELAARPRIGAYDAPNLERLLAERIALYVTSRSEAAGPGRQRVAALGIEVLELDTESVAGTLAAIEQLGARLGRGPAARALAGEIASRIAAVARRAAEVPRRRVLCVVGRDPLYVAGPGSYFDELATAAGGANVLADARSPFALASIEVVLARAPEVIVESADNRPGTPRGRAPGAWGAWPFLPAVRADRVYLVDPSRFSVPGPRLAEMAEAFARMMHPELFGEPRPVDFAPLGVDLAPRGGG